jgi:hypothetical protein
MRILILNSAHGKYPVGSEGWVQATLRAVRETASPEVTFLISTEPVPWDLTAWLAGRTDARMELMVKSPENDRGRAEYIRLLDDFGLDGNRTKPRFLGEAVPAPAHPKDSWQLRDRLALALADLICPVSIRPGGRLDHLLGESGCTGKRCDDFRVAWTPNRFQIRYSLAGRVWQPLPRGEWLVHWTRACPGKWPGERSADFFRDLLEHPERYVRSAEATLARMLREGRIRGSSWKTPGGVPLVAFSALSPGDALTLMRWRQRFIRYSFEPCGIAVRKDALVPLGAAEVVYADGKAGNSTAGSLFTHAAGANEHWMAEKEWRLPGDLMLEDIPPDSALVIVPDSLAAEALESETASRFPVHVLFRK